MVTERIKCCRNYVQQDSDIVWFEKELLLQHIPYFVQTKLS